MEKIDVVLSKSYSEDASLLTGRTRSWLSVRLRRYRITRKCVSAKAALLILLWSFVLGSMSGFLLNSNALWELLRQYYFESIYDYYFPSAYAGVAAFYCFFPIAGCLADIKCGRYRAVLISVTVVFISTSLLTMIGIASIPFLDYDINFPVPIYIIALVVIAPLNFGLLGFNANVVQFGMDQLHDTPGEDRTLFIHWYVWLSNLSRVLVQTPFSVATVYRYADMKKIYHIGFLLLLSLTLLASPILIITLCLAQHKRNWFLIEPGRSNPYRLVYRVTKFAWQHKTPVRRSAFTYCEDEVPTGLDLGKEKYGGCFTTEEVEDVKAFYGILKVLLSFEMVFFLDFAANSVIPLYAHYHTFTFDWSLTVENFLINYNLLSPLLVVICIPLYLFLLRPFVAHYVPGMLKRMGLGMLLVLLSTISSFSMDTAAHLGDLNTNSTDTVCMFATTSTNSTLDQNPALLYLQMGLASLSSMLIYIAVFEFICSQSPHSMKGFLIGLLYAIKGLYQVLATLLAVPFIFGRSLSPSCGFYYYLLNIVIGLVAVLVYVCVARRYRYRERDEPNRIRQYAEDYYSNPHRERNYDYSASYD